MASTAQPPIKQFASLSVSDLQSALPKLQRRIDEINSIDPLQATGTYTPEFSAIRDNINATLMEIFGPNSIEYERYKVWSIYAGTDSRRISKVELVAGYNEGKKRALIKIDNAIKFVNEKLADSRLNPVPTDGEGQKMKAIGQKIFIGHGHSLVWLELKNFLQDELNLTVDEFNRVSTAGIATSNRLEEMLDDAAFAFLILTAEDEGTDGTLHARENVVHEAGLFQGRLGFKKAILLLEETCEKFSNIDGLGYIPFPAGKIRGVFEDIRRVLKREGMPAALGPAATEPPEGKSRSLYDHPRSVSVRER